MQSFCVMAQLLTVTVPITEESVFTTLLCTEGLHAWTVLLSLSDCDAAFST